MVKYISPYFSNGTEVDNILRDVKDLSTSVTRFADQKDGEDWTPAIQAAVDDAAAAGGGTVFFPNGDYGTVSVSVPDNVVFAGQSETGVVIDGLVVTPVHTLQNFTNANKLALTGIGKGQQVLVTAEANRLEQYLGPVSGEAGAGVEFTVDGVRYVYFRNGLWLGKPQYQNVSGQTGAIRFEDGEWQAILPDLTNIYSEDDVDYPWEATGWTSDTPSNTIDQAPTRNDVASDENWEIIGTNTVELFAQNMDGLTLNGVELTSDNETPVGWVNVGQQIQYGYPDGPPPNTPTVFVNDLEAYPSEQAEAVELGASVREYLMIPFPVPSRAKITFNQI